MTENETNTNYRSGYVAILGRPNSGKSTLLNRLLGQPIAGVSAKPQTTRKRQLGIVTGPDYQVVFVDTPGLHESKDKLSQFINSEAAFALEDADILLYLADGSSRPDAMDAKLAAMVNALEGKVPILLAVNKSDALDGRSFAANKHVYEGLLPGARTLAISASTGSGVEHLLNTLREMLPEGPQYFPEEQVTEVYERDIAAEMIRAACLTHLSDEVPYSIAVRVDEYTERENGMRYVHATIYVERDAQKAIVIGKGGAMIKMIGSTARADIERMSGERVYLDLAVKVLKDWKNNSRFLNELGLSNKG